MLRVFLPLVLARWVHFASLSVLFGASFFWLYAAQETDPVGPDGFPRSFRRTVLALRIATVAAALSGLAWLAFILVNMTQDFHSVFELEDLGAAVGGAEPIEEALVRALFADFLQDAF